MSWEGSDAPVWDAERLRTAADAAGVGLWSWNVDTDEIAMDDRSHALWGVPRERSVPIPTCWCRCSRWQCRAFAGAETVRCPESHLMTGPGAA